MKWSEDVSYIERFSLTGTDADIKCTQSYNIAKNMRKCLTFRYKKEGAEMRREEYISDEAVVKRANAAVKIELEKKKAMDIPAVIYDRETQIIYKENSDGTRVEVGKRMRKGRYSERVAEET